MLAGQVQLQGSTNLLWLASTTTVSMAACWGCYLLLLSFLMHDISLCWTPREEIHLHLLCMIGFISIILLCGFYSSHCFFSSFIDLIFAWLFFFSFLISFYVFASAYWQLMGGFQKVHEKLVRGKSGMISKTSCTKNILNPCSIKFLKYNYIYIFILKELS